MTRSMMSRAACGLALVAFTAAPLHAQIEAGRVLDDSTSAPLVGSRIVLQRDTAGTWKTVETTHTDAQGLFQLGPYPPGVYRVALLGKSDPVYFGSVDTLAADSMQQREFRLPVVRRGVASAYLAAEVDHQAEALSNPGGATADPADMHSATSMTRMTAQFVVDADGRADPATFRLTGATSTSTEDALRQSLMSRRFRPATIGGIPVRQVMQESLRTVTRVQVLRRQ